MNFKQLIISLSCFFFILSCTSSSTDDNLVVTGLSLNKKELTLKEGETESLVATITPSAVVTTTTIVWTSSDETVATVFMGQVTAKVGGTAVITAKAGNITQTCTVTVAKKSYQLVWSDEFNGSTLNTADWKIETGGAGWGNNEKQYYTDRADNLRLESGCLVIEAKKEDYSSNSYTSARITTKAKKEFAYGKIEARINLPSGVGTWPAFWMLGTKGSWPSCGEIDIMEHVGKDPRMISHALHTANRNGLNGTNWSSRIYQDGIENNFHTYGIEWKKDAEDGMDCIYFFVDGVQTGYRRQALKDDADWPFNTNFFIIMNLAIGGNWGGTVDDTIFSNLIQMKVDWIRVYQLQ